MNDTLGLTPEIKTVADLEAAAMLLLQYREQLETVEKELALRMVAVRESEFSNRFNAEVDGVQISLEKRIEQLEETVTAFVDTNRADVLPKGRQSRNFASVKISLRDDAPRIEFAGDEDRSSVLARLLKKGELGPAIERLLKRMKLNGWVRLKPELALLDIKTARKAGTITDKQLKSVGLTYKPQVNVNVSPRS